MTTLHGVAAAPGVGIGTAWRYEPEAVELPTEAVEDPDAEVARLEEASAAVSERLQAQSEAAEQSEIGDVLEAQAMMVADPELAQLAADAIREQATPAARAIVEAGETYAAALEASESDYLAERAGDVRDVCLRVARRLLGRPIPELSEIPDGAVVLARDLAPADTAGLDPAAVAGLVTEEGSRTSHTAILAGAMGVPALVAVDGLLQAVPDGEPVGVDGDRGALHVGEEAIAQAGLRQRAEEAAAEQARLRELAGSGPAATADGHRVELAANVGAIPELRAALEAGAEAVGLLRTELGLLDRAEPPSEDEQTELLTEAVRLLDGGRLVVRTFDIGADKPAPFIEGRDEGNPALGLRGIRLARAQPELLDTQLRAVARAAEHGPVAVMAPMVATLEEARWFVERAEAAGLREAGVELGAMVEVPSAVLCADLLAAELDFLSIGTNDLAQYLHAADRMHGDLAHLQDAFSPAVLRAVRTVCDAAADRDCWVGVCGEAASDPAWALVAVGLGVSELSMGAASLLRVRAGLASHALDDCRRRARGALAASDPAGARAAAEADA